MGGCGQRLGESRAGRIQGRHRFRQPEVHQLGARLRQHDVARLQVAMDYPTLVRFFQSFANLDSQFQNLLERQRALVQSIGQRFAVQKFHHQVVDPVLMSYVVQRADMGMVQRRNGARFPVEALLGLRVIGKVGGQNLDGDRAIQTSIARAIHFAHAARTKRRLDLVRSEFCSGKLRHRWGRL